MNLKQKNKVLQTSDLKRSIWLSSNCSTISSNCHVVCCVQCLPKSRPPSKAVVLVSLRGPQMLISILVLKQKKHYKCKIVGIPRLLKPTRKKKAAKEDKEEAQQAEI